MSTTEPCPDPKCEDYLCRKWQRRRHLPTMKVVTAVFSRPDGRVLMSQRHNHKRCPGMWEWPGGKVDPGESDAVALYRECWEELGTVTTIRSLIWVATLWLDVKLTVSLYDCHLDPNHPPRAIESLGLAWFTPTEAVTTLSCTPTTFVAYEEVEMWLAQQRRHPEWKGRTG